LGLLAHPFGRLGRHQVKAAIAVIGHEGVEKHQTRKAIDRARGYGREDHAGVAVADEHDAFEILLLKHTHNVIDVGTKPDIG
jgi:hypothetical protein